MDEMEPETPWSWRDTKLRPQCRRNVLKYRANIKKMIQLVRRIDTNRNCADCGLLHNPTSPLDITTPWKNGVAYTNPMLGTLVCYECAECHKEILPPSINKTLYIFYNLDNLSLDDLAQIARWGNIRAQRYWLGNYQADIGTYPKIIPLPKQEQSRKEWICQKYIQKKWVLDALPRREALCRYNHWEQGVFAILHGVNWVTPKNISSTPKPPQTIIRSQTSTCSRSSLPTRENMDQTAGKKSVAQLANSPKSIRQSVSLATTFETADVGPASFNPFPLKKWDRRWCNNATKILESKVPAIHLTSTSGPITTDTKGTVLIPPSIQVKKKEESVYSDDLYGSGRPLRPRVRPDLINPYERIEEWQLSSFGNPELAVTPDSQWEPLPPLPERPFRPPTLNHRASLPPFPSMSGLSVDVQDVSKQLRSTGGNSESTKTRDDEQKLPVKRAESHTTHAIVEAKDILVNTDLGPVRLTPEEICICGDTIAEEDSSILAALNDYFVQNGVGDEVVEYKCLSDGETEMESELDKNEFESESVEPCPGDVENIGRSFMEENNEVRRSDEMATHERNASHMQNEVSVEMVHANLIHPSRIFMTGSSFELFKPYKQHTQDEPSRKEVRDSVPVREPASFAEPGWRPESCISNESTAEAAISSPRSDDKSTIEELPIHHDPFSNVLSSVHIRHREVDGETGRGSGHTEPEEKVDLLEFLRKSGLF